MSYYLLKKTAKNIQRNKKHKYSLSIKISIKMSDNCIFCKIVEKKAPASIVYEDEKTLAFMSIQPINVGHTLVIPKKHYENIYEIAGATQRRVDFVNLPPQCKISIFTASGKLVRTLEHDTAEDFGRESWDLRTDDGPEVAFGVYFFVVEAEGIGITRGKFAVIK